MFDHLPRTGAAGWEQPANIVLGNRQALRSGNSNLQDFFMGRIGNNQTPDICSCPVSAVLAAQLLIGQQGLSAVAAGFQVGKDFTVDTAPFGKQVQGICILPDHAGHKLKVELR